MKGIVLSVLLAGSVLASDSAAGLGQAKAAVEITSQQKSEIRRAMQRDPNNSELQQAYMNVCAQLEINRENVKAWQQQLNLEERARRDALRDASNRRGPAWLGGWGIIR
jgi:hypothetical protein